MYLIIMENKNVRPLCRQSWRPSFYKVYIKANINYINNYQFKFITEYEKLENTTNTILIAYYIK